MMTDKNKANENVNDNVEAKSNDSGKNCEEQNKSLEAECAEVKDALMRAYAEMENMRKRFIKEKEDSIKFASTKFAKDILLVVDNFERALSNFKCDDNMSGDVKVFYDGISITHKDLVSALAKNGITKIEAKKLDDFDHNVHQIMCEVDADNIDAGKVVDIYQTGYLINGRLLRPALVSVARKK